MKYKPSPRLRDAPLRRRTKKTSKRPGNRNISLRSNATTIEYSSGVPSSVVTFPVEFARSQFAETPLVMGNHRDPNNHTYEKYVCMMPTFTLKKFTNGEPNWMTVGSLHGATRNITEWYGTYSVHTWGTGQAAYNRCSHKFFKQLIEESANLAVDTAEWKQSRDMIAKNSDGISRILKRTKRVSYRWWKNLQWNRANPKARPRYVPEKNRNAKTPLEIVANTWLEYKLGWSPLLSTIFGVLDHNRNSAKRFRVKASTKGLRRHVLRPEGLSPTDFFMVSDIEYSCYITFCADYENSTPFIHEVSRLTSLNPVAIAWELVPFSFVVDYFFNIGRYLEEVEKSFAFGLRFLRGYEVYSVRYLNKITVPFVENHVGFSTYVQTEGRGREYHVWKQRTKWLTTPWPIVPSFEPKLGAARLMTLASLAVQLFYSKTAWK